MLLSSDISFARADATLLTVRELAYAIATETHAPNNLQVLKYLKANFGASQEQVDTWYRHWLSRTFAPVETRLEQLGTGDFLFDGPGLFEVVLLPQIYNARRFALDLSAMPRIERIEAACLALGVACVSAELARTAVECGVIEAMASALAVLKEAAFNANAAWLVHQLTTFAPDSATREKLVSSGAAASVEAALRSEAVVGILGKEKEKQCGAALDTLRPGDDSVRQFL